MSIPKVFINYSHDSVEHSQRVLEFSNQLRANGVDATLDQYESRPSQGWPRWSEELLLPENSKYVLLICTETYFNRIRGKVPADEGLGVYWEGGLIYDCILEEKSIQRFIPIIFDRKDRKYVPRPLRGTHYLISTFDLSDPGYHALYRELIGQLLKPPLGAVVDLKSIPPVPPREVRSTFDVHEMKTPMLQRVMVGLLVLILLVATAWRVTASASVKCSEAETAIQEAGSLISPAFPDLMCRKPYQGDDENPWQDVRRKTAGAERALAGSEWGAPWRTKELKGTLTLIGVMDAYDHLHRASYDAPKLEERQGWKEAVNALGAADPLILARRLEQSQDQLEEMAQLPEGPCTQRWIDTNDGIERLLKALTSSGHRDCIGCGWSYRAEQAVALADYCGEDREARLAEAAVALQRSNQLSRDKNVLYLAILEVMRGATAEISKLSPERANLLLFNALSAIRSDARLLNDMPTIGYLTAETQKIVSVIENGHRGFLEWAPQLIAEIGQRPGGLDPTVWYPAADVWIAADQLDIAKHVLDGIRAGHLEASRMDYRQAILEGKVECFGASDSSQSAGASDPFLAAIPFENDRRAARYGHASVFSPLCAAANGERTETQLRTALNDVQRINRIDPKHDVCEALDHDAFKKRLKAKVLAFATEWEEQCNPEA